MDVREIRRTQVPQLEAVFVGFLDDDGIFFEHKTLVNQ